MSEPWSDLTDEQAAAMIGTSNIFLTACPGSGKTRSVGARAGWLQSEGKRVALLSHTKVGRAEMAESAETNLGSGLSDGTYVGTLHAFFVRFVLRPFGHLVTGSAIPVSMNEPAVLERQPSSFDSRDYRFTPVGVLVAKVGTAGGSPATLEAVRKFKTSTAADGLVGYDDAIYWSYRVLNEHVDLAQAVASRFDEILIDEAQDSSPMQIACLEVLHGAGLNSLVLVGDFDQSIFSFAGASPELCENLAKSAQLSGFRLTKNFRSSQQICNLSASFRQRAEPDTAVGADAGCAIAPMLIKYSPDFVADLPTRFSAILDDLGEQTDDTIIVTRGNALGTAIRGYARRDLPDWAKPLVEAARAAPSYNFEVVRAVEALLTRSAEDAVNGTIEIEAEFVRDEVINLIDSLPALKDDMIEWLVTAQELVVNSVQRLAPTELGPALPSIPATFIDQDASVYASDTGGGPHAVESVHGVKGRGVSAVMLVAATNRSSYYPDPAEQWAAMLRGEGPQTEELRIVYVALTRARRVLVMAVPETTSDAAVATFVSAGFELRD